VHVIGAHPIGRREALWQRFTSGGQADGERMPAVSFASGTTHVERITRTIRVAAFAVRINEDAAVDSRLRGKRGTLSSFDGARYIVVIDEARHAVLPSDLSPIDSRQRSAEFETERVIDEKPGPMFLVKWRPCLMRSEDVEKWTKSGSKFARSVDSGIGGLRLVEWAPSWEDGCDSQADWVVGDYNSKYTVTVEGALRSFTFAQAPESGLVGTSLWDAAAVFMRYLDREAASGVGPLAAEALRGRRVLELGCGLGLPGMAFAAYGAQVTFTDKPDVMEHCERNWESNFGRGGGEGGGDAAASSSSLSAPPPPLFLAHCWGDEPRSDGLTPPYEIVVATDCLYRRPQVGDPTPSPNPNPGPGPGPGPDPDPDPNPNPRPMCSPAARRSRRSSSRSSPSPTRAPW
jgi:hypothetical protein